MDLSISQLMQLQREQYEAHKDQWNPRDPEQARAHILYMIEEIGEAIAILKKKGETAVMEDEAIRAAFLEELSDIMMYYVDVLLCFRVSPEDFSASYVKKHTRNLGRNYSAEYKELYQNAERDKEFEG